MKCIICNQKKDQSEEHVFPKAIGGSLIVNNVCKECNVLMGRKVDSNLSDDFLILFSMLKQNIYGNKNKLKTNFYNNATEFTDNRSYTFEFNDHGEKVKVRKKNRIEFIEKKMSNNKTEVFLSSSESDIELLLERANEKRIKNYLKPLFIDEFRKMITYQIQMVPSYKLKFSIDFDKISISLLKIAHEVAFYYLGENYFSDKIAKQHQKIIQNSLDNVYTKSLINNIQIYNRSRDKLFFHYPYSNIVYINKFENKVIVNISILNTYIGEFIVSENSRKYDFEPNIIINNAKTKKIIQRTLIKEKELMYKKIMSFD